MLNEPSNENPLFDYIWDGLEPKFKENVSEADQKLFHEHCEALKKSIDLEFFPDDDKCRLVSRMLDDVLVTAKDGKSVILDMLRTDGIYASKLHKEHPSFKVILVFCPFEELVKSLLQN